MSANTDKPVPKLNPTAESQLACRSRTATYRRFHTITKTVQFKLDFEFSENNWVTAQMAANERGCSQHKVLSERLRAEAARVLRNGGFAVDQS